MLKSLEELVQIIRERKKVSPDKSYTKQLLIDKKLCSVKVKEELKELLDAIKNGKDEDTLTKQSQNGEAADLLYHLFVLLEANNIQIEDGKIFLTCTSCVTIPRWCTASPPRVPEFYSQDAVMLNS
jgi:phosphoribosyl-ATP pyrophosphohydrolase